MPHLSTTIGCGYRYLSEIPYYFICGNHEASSLGLCSSGPTAFCKNTGHGASGKKIICATTRNRLISVIEYIATVDPSNSY